MTARRRPTSVAAGAGPPVAPPEGVEQVRAVDQQPLGADERVGPVLGREVMAHRDRSGAIARRAVRTTPGRWPLRCADAPSRRPRRRRLSRAEPVPGSRRCSPRAPSRATTSSTSRTTRCTTGPTTSIGWPRWARRSAPTGSSARRGRPRSGWPSRSLAAAPGPRVRRARPRPRARGRRVRRRHGRRRGRPGRKPRGSTASRPRPAPGRGRRRARSRRDLRAAGGGRRRPRAPAPCSSSRTATRSTRPRPRLMPGAGSMVAAVETASGVTPDLDRQAGTAPPPRGGPRRRRRTRATR